MFGKIATRILYPRYCMALAVGAKERSQYFPDVPTTREAGYPSVEMTNYYSLLVTAKTPREIVTQLHDAIVTTVKTPSVRDRLMEVGADPRTMGIDEFTRFIRDDIAKWDSSSRRSASRSTARLMELQAR